MCGLVVPIALAHEGCIEEQCTSTLQSFSLNAVGPGANVEAQDNNGSHSTTGTINSTSQLEPRGDMQEQFMSHQVLKAAISACTVGDAPSI